MTDAHPTWCSPRLCTADVPGLPLHGGEHRSEPLELDMRRVFTTHGAVEVLTASLTQAACSWTTETFLRLVTGDQTEITLPVVQAAGVIAQLNEFVTTNS